MAKSDIFTGEEKFEPNQLENLMELALLENKPNFVELLLENGVNINSFLTKRRLMFLYNSLKVKINFGIFFSMGKSVRLNISNSIDLRSYKIINYKTLSP